MSTLEDVSSLEEAAEYLRITPDALARLARRRAIGSLKQGRKLTFPRQVVLDYVESNTAAATPPNPHGLTDRSLARIKGRVS